MNKQKSDLLLTILFFSLLCCSSFADEGKRPPSIQQLIDAWHADAGEVEFYGKVIDQNGDTVEDALISVNAPIPIGWMKDKSRKQQVRTDKNGRFEVNKQAYGVKEFKGGFLFIDSIAKDGYEYDRSKDIASFSYRSADRFIPDKNNPVVFHMRKKREETFLFHEIELSFQTQMKEAGKPSGFDFIQRHKIRDLARPTLNGETLVCDMQVNATFNTNNTTWSVVVSPGNTNGGIIASDQLFYEAPQEGYTAEWIFTPEDHKLPKEKFLYLRSRNPVIYSRINVTYINANREFFRLSGESVTNPYGDGNLEAATDVPYEVTKELTDKAKSAFQKGKRPEKPDLSKLIKEVKAKREKNLK